MDIETFDEYEFSNEQIGERRLLLKENEEYKALRLDGKLLDIVLPPQIPLKVVETAAPARAGLTTSWKEAKLETGLQIMVPLFIANGDNRPVLACLSADNSAPADPAVVVPGGTG